MCNKCSYDPLKPELVEMWGFQVARNVDISEFLINWKSKKMLVAETLTHSVSETSCASQDQQLQTVIDIFVRFTATISSINFSQQLPGSAAMGQPHNVDCSCTRGPGLSESKTSWLPAHLHGGAALEPQTF